MYNLIITNCLQIKCVNIVRDFKFYDIHQNNKNKTGIDLIRIALVDKKKKNVKSHPHGEMDVLTVASSQFLLKRLIKKSTI